MNINSIVTKTTILVLSHFLLFENIGRAQESNHFGSGSAAFLSIEFQFTPGISARSAPTLGRCRNRRRTQEFTSSYTDRSRHQASLAKNPIAAQFFGTVRDELLSVEKVVETQLNSVNSNSRFHIVVFLDNVCSQSGARIYDVSPRGGVPPDISRAPLLVEDIRSVPVKSRDQGAIVERLDLGESSSTAKPYSAQYFQDLIKLAVFRKNSPTPYQFNRQITIPSDGYSVEHGEIVSKCTMPGVQYDLPNTKDFIQTASLDDVSIDFFKSTEVNTRTAAERMDQDSLRGLYFVTFLDRNCRYKKFEIYDDNGNNLSSHITESENPSEPKGYFDRANRWFHTFKSRSLYEPFGVDFIHEQIRLALIERTVQAEWEKIPKDRQTGQKEYHIRRRATLSSSSQGSKSNSCSPPR